MRNIEHDMRNAICEMRNIERDMRNAICEMRNIERDTRNAICEILKTICETRYAKCEILNAICEMRWAKCDTRMSPRGLHIYSIITDYLYNNNIILCPMYTVTLQYSHRLHKHTFM